MAKAWVPEPWGGGRGRGKEGRERVRRGSEGREKEGKETVGSDEAK